MEHYAYIPGVCNIGPSEIKNRRQIGIVWGIGALVLGIILFFFNANHFLRLLVFLPAIVAFSGFYQAKFHFCAGYGMNGLYNVAKTVGHADTVEQAEFRLKDKQKAQQIFLFAFLSAILVAILFYFA